MKIQSIPKALWAGVVLTLVHLARSLFCVLHSQASQPHGARIYFYLSLRDLEESLGWLITLFHTAHGQHLTRRASYNKTCYLRANTPRSTQLSSEPSLIPLQKVLECDADRLKEASNTLHMALKIIESERDAFFDPHLEGDDLAYEKIVIAWHACLSELPEDFKELIDLQNFALSQLLIFMIPRCSVRTLQKLVKDTTFSSLSRLFSEIQARNQELSQAYEVMTEKLTKEKFDPQKYLSLIRQRENLITDLEKASCKHLILSLSDEQLYLFLDSFEWRTFHEFQQIALHERLFLWSDDRFLHSYIHLYLKQLALLGIPWI